MKKKLIAAALVLLVLVPLGVFAALTVWGEDIFNAQMRPGHARADDPRTAAPDYKDDRYWASLPGREGAANLVPAGERPRSGDASVAVFYIHPTSYLSGERWNAPLFTDSWAWEMVDHLMVTQASAFNGCCDVYAPHYRQATLWSFIDRERDDGLQALDIAYQDVETAFDEFIWRFGGERPFIIAGHSQGSAHALRLLAERVNDNPILRRRLVAAYLVGYYMPLDIFERELTNIPPCNSATETACVVHWSTFGEGGAPSVAPPHWYSSGWEYGDDKRMLCTNPLNWRRDGKRVAATEHPGVLDVENGYTLYNMFFNSSSGEKTTELPAVQPGWTWAECQNGVLYVETQTEGPFASGEGLDYHTRDYSLFYQAIRDNAQVRATAFGPLAVE